MAALIAGWAATAGTEFYAPQFKDDPDRFRRAVGAIALMTYATSLGRPWTLSLVADPLVIAYRVEGADPVEGEVDLGVWRGADVYDDETAACADLADAQLASSPVEGSQLIWDTGAMAPHAIPTSADASVDEDSSASFSYETATESKEAAQKGALVTAQVSVGVTLVRSEIERLNTVVRGILLGDAAGSPIGSTAKALYAAMAPKLDAVAYPKASTTIEVTYHTPPASPSPKPTQGRIAGTWNGTWAGVTYPTTAGAFTVVFAQSGNQLTGSITISGTPCLTGGSISGTVSGDVIAFGAVQGEVTVLYDGAISGDTMAGTWSTDCGNAVGTWQAVRAG